MFEGFIADRMALQKKEIERFLAVRMALQNTFLKGLSCPHGPTKHIWTSSEPY